MKKELQAQISKLASLESVDKKIAALKEELTGDFITSESLQALNEKVDKLSAEVMQIIGHRLTSLALIPTEHINGIAAIISVAACRKLTASKSGAGNHSNATKSKLKKTAGPAIWDAVPVNVRHCCNGPITLLSKRSS